VAAEVARCIGELLPFRSSRRHRLQLISGLANVVRCGRPREAMTKPRTIARRGPRLWARHNPRCGAPVVERAVDANQQVSSCWVRQCKCADEYHPMNWQLRIELAVATPRMLQRGPIQLQSRHFCLTPTALDRLPPARRLGRLPPPHFHARTQSRESLRTEPCRPVPRRGKDKV
jgi:hypothetical protein